MGDGNERSRGSSAVAFLHLYARRNRRWPSAIVAPISRASEQRRVEARLWCTLAITVFVLAVLRRAWACDDAFISLRVAKNLISGRGFVFNVGERVLGITNPLWTLVLGLPAALSLNPYLSLVLMGVVVSALAASVLVFGVARDPRRGALVLLLLCLSRAFVDFSTSGLENSLTHLLLFCFYAILVRSEGRAITALTFVTALASVNRLDTLPLFLPALAQAIFVRRRQFELRYLAGALPAFAWFGFCLAYFGFVLPNTSYAKLNAEIASAELWRQGFSYLFDTLFVDPLTALLIGAALSLSVLRARRDPLARAVAISLSIDLAYVVGVGGDFMTGRFLTAATALSAVALLAFAEQALERATDLRPAALALAALSASFTFSPFRQERDVEKGEMPSNRIVNERAWYQEHLWLWTNFRPETWKEKVWYVEGVEAKKNGARVVVKNNIGLFSWAAGPLVHVVDTFGLTEPLLARMPFAYDSNWRTGHLERQIPDGYVKTLEESQNFIEDACLAAYYDRLDTVIHGPLFSRARWSNILFLNLRSGRTVHPCPGKPRARPVGNALVR